MGARPDDAHIALQHVYQLGELVNAGGADDAADPGNAIITLLGRFVAVHALVIHPHRAELDHGEEAVATPNTALHEKHRAAILQHNCQRNRRKKRQ